MKPSVPIVAMVLVAVFILARPKSVISAVGSSFEIVTYSNIYDNKIRTNIFAGFRSLWRMLS